jgi:hypothetical protein
MPCRFGSASPTGHEGRDRRVDLARPLDPAKFRVTIVPGSVPA